MGSEKNRSWKSWLLFLSLSFVILNAPAQMGVIVNEVSNGPTGVQEYFELVVVGNPGQNCATMDLRGWIFDDNNGDFSCGPRSGAGIAQGHARFSATGPWGSVPLGSIIVLYNDDPTSGNNPAVPPADPYDADGDSVYIIPSSNPDIEYADGVQNCTDRRPVGCSSSCPGTGISSYTPSTYTFGGNGWGGIGLRNSGGDAAQTRDAAGNYFHGISYGSTNITGGPDNLQISTSSGSGRVYSFDGGDFRNVANYMIGTAGTVDETPGRPNSLNNFNFIEQFRCQGPLPVIYSQELSAVPAKKEIFLHWATSEEIEAAYFAVQRAPSPYGPFETLDKVHSIGSVHKNAVYAYTDESPSHGMNYYRLRQVDTDGRHSYSSLAEAQIDLSRYAAVSVAPNPASESLTFSFRAVDQGKLQIFDLQGRFLREMEIHNSQEKTINVTNFENGMYIYRLLGQHQAITGRFVVSK